MSFTPLQKIAIRQAEELANELEQQIHALARTHDFVGPLCQRNTPEAATIDSARKISEIMNALRAEQ